MLKCLSAEMRGMGKGLPFPIPLSEALHRGPQVQLQSPRCTVLRVELPVGFGDGIGAEQGMLFAVGTHLLDPGRVYLAVYDDVRNVYPLRPELPRHGLRQSPQAELADRQGREPRLAAQRRRCASEQDGAAARVDHRWQYLTRGVESPGVFNASNKRPYPDRGCRKIAIATH